MTDRPFYVMRACPDEERDHVITHCTTLPAAERSADWYAERTGYDHYVVFWPTRLVVYAVGKELHVKNDSAVAARTYQKKPVRVQAVQLTEAADWEAIAAWCGGRLLHHTDITDEKETVLVVPTLHGEVRAYEGQWVCKGPRDCWPVDEETFAETYEIAEERL
jgi:hypothetical protein